MKDKRAAAGLVLATTAAAFARRIVAGERDDFFSTSDHYSTFARIIR